MEVPGKSSNQEMESLPSTSRKRHRTTRKKALSIVAAVLLWLCLLGGTYYLAAMYLQQTLQEIREENAAQVNDLSERLEAIQVEMAEMQAVLAETDSILAQSDEAVQEVDRMIDKLNRQLAKLEETLQVLGMSPDAPR